MLAIWGYILEILMALVLLRMFFLVMDIVNGWAV